MPFLNSEWASDPAEREKRAIAWNRIVQDNPDLNNPDSQEEFLRTGLIPKTIKTGNPLRIESGQTKEVPNPEGGVPIRVLPETTVDPNRPETRSVRFGAAPEIPSYADMKSGEVVPFKLAPELQGKPFKVLPKSDIAGANVGGMDGILAERVRNGEITLEQAMAMKRSGSGAYALTPEENDALVAAMRRDNNPLPPSLIRSRGPGAKALAQALLQDPDYNPSDAEIAFATAKQGSTAEAGQRGRTLGSIAPMANSLEDILDYAEPLIKVLSPTQVSMVNDAYRKGLQQINDPDANRLLTHMNEATAMYASIMKGGTAAPTDQQFQDAKAIIRGGLSPEGFSGVSDAIRKAARSRVKRLGQAPDREDGGGADRGGGNQPKTVNSQAEYDALPSGTEYIDSHGKRARKK